MYVKDNKITLVGVVIYAGIKDATSCQSNNYNKYGHIRPNIVLAPFVTRQI